MDTPKVFLALADPVRLRLVEALREGELPVGELVHRVTIQQSGVSRHLRILQESGLVRMRPDGQRRLYALDPAAFLALDTWLADYRAVWDARLDRLEDALARRRSSTSPPPSSETP